MLTLKYKTKQERDESYSYINSYLQTYKSLSLISRLFNRKMSVSISNEGKIFSILVRKIISISLSKDKSSYNILIETRL